MPPSSNVRRTTTKQDLHREREMLRYFQPEGAAESQATPSSRKEAIATKNTSYPDKASFPDTALTAFAQLCAIRLRARRAMISLIGNQKQYIVAEATQTLHLADITKSEKEGDELWTGRITVDKNDQLCQHTLTATADQGSYPVFTVRNLQQDSRFNEFPFVKEKPFLKFYAGTPLRTKRGINIGSLFILDDFERPNLTAEQVDFIGTLAQTIMAHLQATAEAKEKIRMQRFSLGINAFVEGRSHLMVASMHDAAGDRWTTYEGTSKDALQKTDKISATPNRAAPTVHSPRVQETTASLHQEESASETSHDEPDHDGNMRDTSEIGHRSTLVRASNILHEALDIQGHGGIVFYDSTKKQRHMTDASSRVHPQKDENDSPASISPLPAEVITSRAGHIEVPPNSGSTSHGFTPMDDEMLHSLLRRYPRGNLWKLDEDPSTSSEEETSQVLRDGVSESNERTPYRKANEKSMLRRHFPNAKQILFYGLWDAGSSRWFTACFAWTTTIRSMWTVEIELNYVMTFGNSVMAQLSRLASMQADRQKADFIGSISHELRSPLHGILVSAEFLSENVEDIFNLNLINTISSCGRTLLDTINHIFDYTKINSFERIWRNNKHSKGKMRALGKVRTSTNKNLPPMLSVFATVDVASLVEEVVEGVYAGQVYQDISSTDVASASSPGNARALEHGIGFKTESKSKSITKDIDIVLDIHHDNYVFVTQPGALKRLVMNIFGNALKYTQKGTINVLLSLDDTVGLDDDQVIASKAKNERVLQIKVNDTGKGISPEYLRSSLYSPFSQEDVLASGTGLGLSIVRSIVTMLQGAITVQSEVGVGTQVTIWLPLSQPSGLSSPLSTPSSVASMINDDSMIVLKREYSNAKVAVYGFENDKTTLAHVLQNNIEGWYGLQVVEHPEEANVIVAEEPALSALVDRISPRVSVIVLCEHTSRNQIASREYGTRFVEFIAKPCGPHKLAMALRRCLEKNQGDNDESHHFPDLSSSYERSILQGPAPIEQMNNTNLDPQDQDEPIEVQTNEMVTAKPSQNALMAIDDVAAQINSQDAKVRSADEYPFPGPLSPHDQGALTSEDTKPDTKSVHAPSSMASVRVSCRNTAEEEAWVHPFRPGKAPAQTRSCGDGDSSDTTPLPPRTPRMLLVDDNRINLRLLKTYMKKRKFERIDTAEDGKLAVDAFEACEDQYDIIFMDISMPVMNGFEATRRIRDIEQHRNEHSENSAALVIALTGLASGRDQAEAFESGVDLFLTKPVSFKEVGKLLDNWERHGSVLREHGDAT